MKRSANKIWESPSRVSEAGSPARMVLFFVVNKLSAFVLVLASLLSLLTIDEAILGRGLEAGWSFLTLGFAIAGLFRILPSIKLS